VKQPLRACSSRAHRGAPERRHVSLGCAGIQRTYDGYGQPHEFAEQRVLLVIRVMGVSTGPSFNVVMATGRVEARARLAVGVERGFGEP